jgi:hypothetical protein
MIYDGKQNMIRKIHAFGDSFVQGDQDDFYHDYPWEEVEYPKPDHGMNYPDRINYLRYNISFVSIIASTLNLDYINYAEGGSGNYPQLDKLWSGLISGKIDEGDIVMFGITTPVRDRISCINFEQAISNSRGEVIAARDLLKSHNIQQLVEIDYYYILSLLERMAIQFRVKIICFNLFDNPIGLSNNRQIYMTFDLLGKEFIGNTLIDILNDTWGSDNMYPYHTQLSIPTGYEKLYTRKKHPSVKGHQKIAEWFLTNVKIN